jgi:hypothetical protein
MCAVASVPPKIRVSLTEHRERRPGVCRESQLSQLEKQEEDFCLVNLKARQAESP